MNRLAPEPRTKAAPTKPTKVINALGIWLREPGTYPVMHSGGLWIGLARVDKDGYVEELR